MKNNFNWDEFLRVARELSKEKYDLEEDADFNDLLERRAEEIKNKIKSKEENIEYSSGQRDLLETDPDKISEDIKGKLNIKIGKFTIINIRDRYKKDIQTKIMENKIMNNGKDLLCTVPIHKDFRFKEMPNIKLFNKLSSSAKLTNEQLTEIVRWLQVIEKYDFLV